MITSSILFVLSGLFVSYMFWSKRGSNNSDSYGDPYVAVREPSPTLLSTSLCSTELDMRLRITYQKMVQQVRAIDREYLREKMHQIAEYTEKKALLILSKLFNRFSKLRDIVTGKDLPKNKGSVSFFLKHIENHKNQLDDSNEIHDLDHIKTLEINEN